MLFLKDLAHHYIRDVESILNLRETCRYYRDMFPWEQIRYWKCRPHAQVKHILYCLKQRDCITIEMYIQWSLRNIKPTQNPYLQLTRHAEIFPTIIRPWLKAQEHKYKPLFGSCIVMSQCKNAFVVWSRNRNNGFKVPLVRINHDGTLVLASVLKMYDQSPTLHDLIVCWQRSYSINRAFLIYLLFHGIAFVTTLANLITYRSYTRDLCLQTPTCTL